jgi:hypothetical protein
MGGRKGERYGGEIGREEERGEKNKGAKEEGEKGVKYVCIATIS